MRVLVIDQCSGSKDHPDDIPVLEQTDLDDHSLGELLKRDDTRGIEARELYSGRQQQYIDEAIRVLRTNGHDVDRYYISAGFGLVSERDQLPPYEVTFATMGANEIDERAVNLDIPATVQSLLASDPSYDVVFLALGNDYYRSLQLEKTLERLPDETTGIVFNQEDLAETFDNVISISARTAEAKEHGAIVIALKGVYLKNFARNVDSEDVNGLRERIVDLCTTSSSSQTGFGEFM